MRTTLALLVLVACTLANGQDLLDTPEGLSLLASAPTAAAGDPLTNSIVSFWPLDEDVSSGSRNGLYGGSETLLTDQYSTVPATNNAIRSLSVHLNGNARLRRFDDATLSLGADTPFTLTCWARWDTAYATNGVLIHKGTFTGTGDEFALCFATSNMEPKLVVGNGSSSASVQWGSGLSTSTWYFVVGWYDSTAQKIYVSVNNGTPVEEAWTGGTQNTSSFFYLGSATTDTHRFTGQLDEVGYWKRALTADERTTLYGSGTGYPMSAPGITNYFVDATSGNNANSGLRTDVAWQTLAKVNATAFLPNHRINFKRGETWTETLTPTNDGSAAAAIVFTAYGSGALPIIDGGSSRTYGINATDRSNLRFEHLHVTGATGAGINFGAGVYTATNCEFVDNADDVAVMSGRVNLLGCTITGADGAQGDGIAIHGSPYLCITNGHIGANTQGMNSSLIGGAGTSYVHSVTFSNITDDYYCEDSLDSHLYGCRFVVNASTSHSLYLNAGDSADYCIVDLRAANATGTFLSLLSAGAAAYRNCTFFGPTNTDAGGVTVAQAGQVLNFTNCIFYNVWRCAYIDGAGSAVNADHCVFFSLTTKNLTSNTSEVSTSDPAFADPAVGNVHLTGSLNGVAISGLTKDADGVTVGSPPDVGAYEYVP